MAVDMFLRLAGIEGESEDSDHPNEIDVLAWSWGGSQPGSLQAGGRSRGNSEFQDLSLTKFVDSSSTDLLKLMATGGQVADGTLTVRKAGGESPLEYIVIKFRPVMVTSVSSGGSGGEDRLTENISLNFGEFEYTYTEQRDDGSGEDPESFGWSAVRNAEVRF